MNGDNSVPGILACERHYKHSSHLWTSTPTPESRSSFGIDFLCPGQQGNTEPDLSSPEAIERFLEE